MDAGVGRDDDQVGAPARPWPDDRRTAGHCAAVVLARTKCCRPWPRFIRAARPGGSLPRNPDRSGVPRHAPLAPRVVAEPMVATAEQCTEATDDAHRRVRFARSARTRPGVARGAGCCRRVALHPLSVPNDRCRCKRHMHVQLYEPRQRGLSAPPCPDNASVNTGALTGQNCHRIAGIRTPRSDESQTGAVHPCKCTCRCN